MRQYALSNMSPRFNRNGDNQYDTITKKEETYHNTTSINMSISLDIRNCSPSRSLWRKMDPTNDARTIRMSLSLSSKTPFSRRFLQLHSSKIHRFNAFLTVLSSRLLENTCFRSVTRRNRLPDPRRIRLSNLLPFTS